MADYNSAYTGAEIDQGVGNGLAAPTTYAPIAHDSTATTYGKGTDTKYGHLKLSDSTSSTSGTSGGIAATPAAVKAVKDAIPSVPSASSTTPNMDGTAAVGTGTTWARADHVHPTDTSRAPTSHATSATTYGAGTSSNYGHVKLSDSTSSTSSTSGGTAATPAAVKAAYDLANGKQDPATTLAGYGITDAASSAELGTFVRPNLLVNGYFIGGGSQQGGERFPINQRGATSYSGNVYGIDRWKGNTNIGADILTTGLKVTATAGSTQVVQIIENSDDLKGMKVTLSALTSSGSLLKTTVTLPDSIPTSNTTIGTGTESVNGYNLYIRAQSGKFYVAIFASSQYTSAGLTLVAVKLELGSTQTLAHQENGTWVLNEIPNYQQELARCQRFAFSIGTSSPPFFVGTTGANSSAPSFFVPTPVSMRANPTVTGMDSVNAQFAGGYKNNVSLSGISCVANNNGIRINATASEAITSNAYEIASYGNRSTVLFSADL